MFHISSQRSRWIPLAWPVLAVLLSTVYWFVLQAQVERDLRLAEHDALREVRSYAEAYEQYLTRSLGQLDQVALQLKHAWEQGGGKLDLADLRRQGMFTDAAFVQVAIVDMHGHIASALPFGGQPAAEPVDPAFVFHSQNNSSAMLIGGVPGDADASQRVVRVTRRLETPDQEFAGMLSLVMRGDYLTSFYNERALGRHGFVALVGERGGLRLEGRPSSPGGSVFSMAPAVAGGAGVTALDGRHYSDGMARLLAWRESAAYPVVALAGVTTDEALAPAAEQVTAAHRTWALLSAALLLAACGATEATRRLLRRRADEMEVQLAYRAATENAKDGFYMATAVRDPAGAIVDFVVVDCNERGASFYGVHRNELIGRRITAIEREHGGQMLEAYREAMRNGLFEDERRMPAGRRAQITWGKRRIVRVGNGLAITLQDISERKAYESELLYLANYDALTGLPSRSWLTRHIPQAIASAAREQTSLALLFIDLDDFKHVNDTRGHVAGDELLKQAAVRLNAAIRPGDKVARLGGDEFVVLVEMCGSDADLAVIADRIAAALGRPYRVGDDLHTVGASIGVSCYPRDGVDADTLVRHGDIAMYAAKKDGGGRCRFFDPALYVAATERVQLRQLLQVALAQQQLELYYQPRVDLASGRLCSMEALLRWRHPEQGMIAPARFIPIAEEYGLIADIGRFVVEQACQQLASWRSAGLPIVPLSINVSPRQFDRGGVHAHLALLLARHQLPASMLEVEITESAMVGEGSYVQDELKALRDLGVRLHVDDFGTGYSSLAQLQRLNMDVLKIDRAFTAELTESREGRALFQAIVSMAKALDMAVVAEGVETPGQLAALVELGCDEAQGYLFAAPMPARQVAALLAQPVLMSLLHRAA